MNPQVLVAINTFERPDLTAVTLNGVFRNKQPETRVLVLDDASTQMGAEWFRQWPDLLLHKREKNLGVGLAARERLRLFLFSDFEWLCALDNDVASTSGFDDKLKTLYSFVKDGPTLLSGYISSCHKVERRAGSPRHLLMQSIGGLNHFMDRQSAHFLLNAVPEYRWGKKWDWYTSTVVKTRACPVYSYFEHLGRHGCGVNGISKDRAVNFYGN